MPKFSQLDLEKKMEYLYNKKIFPRVHQFINTQKKRRKNQDCLEYVLNQFYLKFLKDRHAFDDKGPWAYCQHVVDRQSGNYFERDHVATAQKQKRALEEFVERERVFELTQGLFKEV